ncbi:WAT1-related protein At1g09380-like [Lolium rigidum]|uniref:WAT1-related protein At1g09380-like n=1 Tax=Lolium rigidum TaxID=89674 RepID=UPI001F5E1D7E|nr:WAT1-related protein At1g09380-like [Lolium rigidum]
MCSLAAAYNFSIVFDRLIKLRENINMSVDVAGAEKKKKPLMAEGLLLAASMVLVQGFTIGALLLSKVAFNIGMAPFVLLAYRNLIGSISVAPFAFYFEREMMKKVNLKIWCWISVNALFGIVLAMGLHYYGLRATNAGYTVNFLNVIPVVTFIIAVILRLEKLKIATFPGKMKVVGTVSCVGGTMVISLYKGKLLHLWPTHLLKSQLQAVGGVSSVPDHHNMLIGTLFLAGSSLSYAFWFIIQARVSKEFPSKYFSTMLACVSGTVQAMVIGVILNHDPSAWAVKWDLQLLTVVYSGVFNTGVTFCLISWAVARRGPTYPSMFNSLALIVTMILDSVLLGTDFSVGSLLGAILIIVGLYAFLWGKGKEVQEQRKQMKAAANGDQSKGSAAAGNGVDSLQVGKHEVRIHLEVSERAN